MKARLKLIQKKISITLIFSWFAVFAIAPIGVMAIVSVMLPSDQSLFIWHFSLQSYQQLLSSVYVRIFVHSFEFAIACTAITLLIAYPAAFCLSQLSPRPKSLLLLLLIVPFWTSSLIRTYAMMALVKTKGVINTVLLALGVIHQPILMLYTNAAMLIGLAYNLLPYMMLPLYSNFEKLDRRLFDAAADLGASRRQIFWHITLPLTMPGVMSGILFVFLPAMTLFYIPDLLGGARGILLGNLVKTQFVVMSDWPGGAATSIVLTLVLLLMLVVVRWRVKQTQLQELV